MMSRSYTNLLALAEGNFPAMGGGGRRIRRVMTVPATLSELDDEDSSAPSDGSSASSVSQNRVIVVANQLPIRASCGGGGEWSFSLDHQSLLLQLRDGLPDDTELIFVGSLRGVEIPPGDQDDVAQQLLEEFKCVPAFLPPSLSERFYHGFCKSQLWPLLHYTLPRHRGPRGPFDRSLWEAYVSANRLFAQKVIEVLSPNDDYVWVHDYHLMAVPSFLRHRFCRLRIGFFLHSPFPSSEIFRALPFREEILRSLLNCDLIGFHTFDYARHFLSCCSRMLGLSYHSRRGYIGLDYFGRNIGIKICPVGVHMAQLRSALAGPDHKRCAAQLWARFRNKTVLLGVDDMDVFKGIDLKLLAFEQMLRLHPEWQERAVLVQIAIPGRGRGRELDEAQADIQEHCDRINREFGSPLYEPVVFINRAVPFDERSAYYAIAECVVVTAVRDGMNLIPYEYIICRQGPPGVEVGSETEAGVNKSMLVVSEFIGCSPSLSGAIRVNPWNVEATSEAMNQAISMPDQEKQLRHEKHYRYVSTHDVAYWSRSFLQDMERTCKDQFTKTCWGIGLGFGFRVVALDPNFRKLKMDMIITAYQRAKHRAIFLDYDGTLKAPTSITRDPDEEVIAILDALSTMEENMVYIVSGRRRDILEKWFAPCKRLCLAAEHGYFLRWGLTEEDQWSEYGKITNSTWMQLAEPVMQHYTEATDGSYIETKETALVWHHGDADQGFASTMAKELFDHLDDVLSGEPVVVKSGQFIVEAKPQGVSKGTAAEKFLSTLKDNGNQADFVLCIGDDRSDEDMFEVISNVVDTDIVAPNTSVFACTVGQKPSKARYYLDDTAEVIALLKAFVENSERPPPAEGSEEKLP